MAQGRRVERVAALIRREISELFQTGIRDERLHQGMVSITHVDLARDLQHCRIHVSVFGSEEQRQQAMDGLRSATPFLKGELGRRLQLRRTPELVFCLDRGLEQGSAVLGLLHQLERERRGRDPLQPLESEQTDVGDPDPASEPLHRAGPGSHSPAASPPDHGL